MGIKTELDKSRDLQIWEDEWESSNKVDAESGASEIRALSYAARLTNQKYIKNTASKTPQAIIKVQSGAIGKKALKNLLNYITRDAEHRLEGEQPLGLETQDSQILSDEKSRANLIKEWEKQFKSRGIYERQGWRLDMLGKLDKERMLLLSQSEKRTLTDKEKERLERVTDAVNDKKYELTWGEQTRKLKWQLRKERFGMRTKEEIEKELAEIEEAKKNGTIDQRRKPSTTLKVNAPADTQHIILSIGGKGHNKAAAEKAVREFLNETFTSAGYRNAFVLHDDTENLHAHVVIQNHKHVKTPEDLKSRLAFTKEDLFYLRQSFADKLTKNGIERITTLRRDRDEILDKIKKGHEGLFKNNSWYEEKLEKGRPVNAVSRKAGSIRSASFMLENIKKELTKEIKPSRSRQLKELKKEIMEHKKTLLKVTPEKLEKERDATMRYFEAETKRIEKQGKALDIFQPESGYARKVKKSKDKAQEEFMKKHHQEIKEAISYLKQHQSIMRNEEKQKTTTAIKTLQSMQGKTKRRLGF